MAQQVPCAIARDSATPDETQELNLVRVVDRATLRARPFDYVRLENVFPADLYGQMLENFPATENFHPVRHPDALRADGTSTRLHMHLHPEELSRLPDEQRLVWSTVATALCAPELEGAFKRKFRTALEDRFRRQAERIPLRPMPTLVRDLPGYHIRIHADVPTKAITVQFYLPSDASQAHLGTIFHTNRRDDGTDQPVAMQFLPRSGYAFPVRQNESWHSAPMTTEADGERRSIMLTYYVDGGFYLYHGWRYVKYWWRKEVGVFFGWHSQGHR